MNRPPAGLPADDELFEPTGKWASPAIYASNWRTIIITDAMIGVAVAWAGVMAMLFWNVLIGSFVGAVGLTYVVAVGRRYLQWKWLRRQAGLDT
ncbi:MAG: hypothetical protein JJE52_13500 [Acidimicrobiia bacterium]|nr:hypothetical protein [Acidimicrobiia bacterium]